MGEPLLPKIHHSEPQQIKRNKDGKGVGIHGIPDATKKGKGVTRLRPTGRSDNPKLCQRVGTGETPWTKSETRMKITEGVWEGRKKRGEGGNSTGGGGRVRGVQQFSQQEIRIETLEVNRRPSRELFR